MNILFLDIDGVLCTHLGFKKYRETGCTIKDSFVWDSDGAAWLRLFCLEHNYKIVISSTWKHHQDMLKDSLVKHELYEFLYHSNDLVTSCTADVNNNITNLKDFLENNKILYPHIPFSRSLEILDWLSTNAISIEQSSIIILDDDSYDIDYWRNKSNNILVVKTHWYDGITDENKSTMHNHTKERRITPGGTHDRYLPAPLSSAKESRLLQQVSN